MLWFEMRLLPSSLSPHSLMLSPQNASAGDFAMRGGGGAVAEIQQDKPMLDDTA